MTEQTPPTYEELVERNQRLANMLVRRNEEFEQTLRIEVQKAKAQALNDVANQMHDRFTASWIRGKANEHIHGPRKIVGAFAVPETKETKE